MAISVRRPVPARFPISGEYLQADGYWTPDHKHLGVDFDCPTGTPVESATIVGLVYAVHRPGDGWGNGSFGICVIIDIPNTPWYYIYAHLSAVKVTVGETVKPGDIIGLSGATGDVTGPHLHVQASTDPGFPRDEAVTGDPILGIRNGMPDPKPVPPPAITLADVSNSLNNLNVVVLEEKISNRTRDASLDSRLSSIERAIQALVNALPKG